MTVSDIDATGNSVTLSVTSGDPDSLFRLNGDVLEVNKDIDLDYPTLNPPVYTLNIEAVDSGLPPRSATSSVTVIISPTNDHSPHVESITPSDSITVRQSTGKQFLLY